MQRFIGFFLLLAAPAAFAHPGHETAGFLAGLMHPLSGLDHLLALVGAGLWGAQLGGRGRWVVPVGFVAGLAGGLIAARLGMFAAAFEPGIAASVLVFGLLLAGAAWLPSWLGGVLVGSFALLHGVAHGVELPAGPGGVAASLGLLAGSAAVLGAAALADRLHPRARGYLRPVGAGIAAGGAFLVAAL